MMHLLVAAAALAALINADDTFSMEFSEINSPFTDAEKREVRVSTQMRRNNSVINTVEWQTLLRTGDVFNGVTFGAFKTVTGQPVYKLYADAATLTGFATNQTAGPTDVSNNDPTGASGMDFTSLIPESVGSLNYRGVSHMESGFGQFMTFKTTFNQDTCRFGPPTEVEVMDLSSINGTWINCAGSISPWATHLGSEEYEPNAKYFTPTTLLATAKSNVASNKGFAAAIGFARYYNKYPESILTMADLLAVFKPYNYGFIPEVNAIATPKTAVKHYTMGRKAFELTYVMPDRKTAYSTDDGDYGLLNKFVATRVNDLSEGILYCSKMTQTSTSPLLGGSFSITWIQMSTSATDAQIKTIIESGILFTDIFETAPLDLVTFPLTTPGKGCDISAGFIVVDTTGEAECLKVKTGMELAASRLETRRYAHMLGCTTEWTKMEGFTHDAEANVAYMAISRVEANMITTYAKAATTIDHISLAANPCGCVYRLPLTALFDATTITAIICGKDLGSSLVPAYSSTDNNRCDVNSISNPDNLHFDNKYKNLYIGEDGSGTAHQSDFMWHWNPKNGELTRLLSSPYGAEVTSTWTHHIGSCSLVQAVVQHPYGESDQTKVSEPLSQGNQAYLGFITLPAPAPSAAPTTAAPSKTPSASPVAEESVPLADWQRDVAVSVLVSGFGCAAIAGGVVYYFMLPAAQTMLGAL